MQSEQKTPDEVEVDRLLGDKALVSLDEVFDWAARVGGRCSARRPEDRSSSSRTDRAPISPAPPRR